MNPITTVAPKKILIVGCSGTGKSTLSRQLGLLLEIPVVHLDRMFWRPGWQNISRQQLRELMIPAMERPSWIIDGNFQSTLELRMQYADTVIFLDYPRRVFMTSVLKRIWQTYGTSRADLRPGCPEKLDWEFLRWVWNFQRDEMPELRKHLQLAPSGLQFFHLTNRNQLKQVKKELLNQSKKTLL
jgi:adenylate kinase family enzyme